MKTKTKIIRGYKITWTSDGEHYTYVIYDLYRHHILTTCRGSCSAKKATPTVARMRKAVGDFIRDRDL